MAVGTLPAQTVRFGWDSLRSGLGEVLAARRPRRLLLVVGPRSYAGSGAEAIVEPMLDGLDVVRYARSDSMPTLDELRAAQGVLRESGADLVIAVGGGGVLDVAKASRVAVEVDAAGGSVRVAPDEVQPPAVPLVAVPTTAGTGAEATRFAVVYLDGIKHSIDAPRVLPEHAIVDPSLSAGIGPRATAVAGMDALAQGMESLWSVASNAASARPAGLAVRLAWQNLEAAVRAPTQRARTRMSLAAHLSGRAIDSTRTTASHAASYPMTARFGIPHGHAVALSLPGMLVFNAGVTEDDVLDPRGVAAVQERIARILELIGATDPEDGRRLLVERMERLGLETSLADLGVTDLDLIVSEGFNPARAGNNPRRLTPDALRLILGGSTG